ncbi:MAG: hypothetical protein CMB20_001310 [Methanobacteriota archaeon]|nr:MAG: hypothetical protein CMB20_001310 [Euryarchaeota archaeon]
MAIDYQSKRRLKSFQNRKVRESLPEFYTSEFPTLVTFLEKYYDFLDSADGTHAFGDDARQFFATKDIREMPSDLLNNLVSELAGGLNTGENFTDTRYALTRLAELARTKGSRFSLEEFFRLFFQQRAEVEYGKESIFKVGDSASQIGVESIKFIQNNALFQTFGLLIKTGLSVDTWSELYKKFVHPSGFFFSGQVVSDTEAISSPTAPIVLFDSSPGPSVISEASAPFSLPFVQLTSLIDSGGGNVRQSNLNELVSDYQNFSLSELDTTYHTVRQIITPNSFTFDDSSIRDSDENATPDFSLTLETMDNEIFTRRVTDSAF